MGLHDVVTDMERSEDVTEAVTAPHDATEEKKATLS
jgi:hypothetical protein